MKRIRILFLLSAPLLACSSGRDRAVATDSASGSVGDFAALIPAGAIRFAVASTGNSARYRVREQLVSHDLPNDAIGATEQISGALTIDSTGAIVPSASKIIVGMGMLKSDSDRRDGYVRNRILETEKYPEVTLVPTAIKGLTAAAVASPNEAGPLTFEVTGDLTVRGVTHPTTWRVTARQAAGKVTGTASTKFTFGSFGINQPRVPVLLSVADTIALEYDFTLTRESATGH